MKKILALSVFALLLTGCNQGESPDDNDLLDMMGDGENEEGTQEVEGEVPYSEGPSSIPSELIPNE